MQIVYFPEQLHARAPSVMGVLCDATTNSWLTLLDVIDCVRAGEAVAIRPASATELQRAEGRAALYEIGVQLGAQVAALLDEEPRGEADRKMQILNDAISSIDVGIPDLIGPAPAPEALETAAPDVAEAAPQDVVDDIPEFFEALQHAYAAGDAVTAWRLAAHITSRLLDPVVAARTSAA